MGLSTLPPLKAVRVPSILMQQHHKRKHRTSKHHYLLRMRRDESLRLRRLGSGLLEQDVLDSSILTHLVSLLDTNRGGPYVLGGDLPDNDARSHSSEHTGSFKGGAVPLHAARSMGARHTPRGSWPVTVEDTDKEFMGDLPVAAMRDMSTASSSMSSIPQLPPIGKVPLSPIRDVSRETSQLVTLPRIHHDDHDHAGSMPTVQVMPPTPQQSTLTGALATPRSDGQRLQRVTEGDPTLAEVSGYNLSRESTPRDPAAPAPTVRTGRKSKVKGPKVTHGPGVRRRMKDVSTSTQNVRSLAAGSLESKSVKGSMIMAPDGEIISVGGSVVPSRPHDVGVIGDVTQPHRHYDANMTDESGMSDDEPDEWRTTGRVKKPRSLSSKLSDSVKRTVKREIDYTSGDIDATMSIHSWSYAPKGEEGEFGLVKAGSVRSLPGLSYDGASQTARSSVTEQDILDTLTEHAKRIADSVLSNTEAGQDLEKDVRGAIQEIMDAQRSSSAGPTTSEYKDLIRQSLTTAVAKAAGLDPEQFPEDAEISPDLLEALASQKLTPDDIAIYHDEETGRPVIKSRQEIAQALGGVSEGHIYMVPNGKGGSYVGSDAGIKRQMSIPADRASLVDNMEYDVISYGGTEVMSERGRPTGKSKAGSKPGSIAGGTIADLKDHPFESVKGSVDASPEAEQDAFEQRLQQMEKEVAGADKKSPSQRRSSKGEDQTPALPGDGSPKLTLDLDGQSVKSGKTGVSQKTEKSEESKKKKAKTPDEPFVVGQSGQKGELEKLYGPVDSPTKKKGMPKQKADLSELFGAQGPGTLPQGAPAGKSESKSPVKGKKPKKDDKKEKGKKKGKKKKDKKEEEAAPEPEPTPAAEAPPSAPIPETKEPTPVPPSSRELPVSKPMTASSSERPLQSSPEMKTDDEMEFTIVREESSPEPEPPQRTSLPPTYPVEEEEEEEEEEDIGDNGEEDNLKAISNREARAAKRAAAAAKRKEEVERRRKEREEQVKREKEELERQEQLKREMEMERKRREEERRLRKQKEAEEADRELREMEEQERRKKLAEERERKAKEEYQRKLEEMRRKQLEEEAKRMELQLQKQKEEEERRAQEELLLSQMAEQERLEYEKKKKEEEEERKRKEEAERLKREEEARQAMEEARRLAEEMARKQAELEARLKFNRALQIEAGGLDHSHDINRAFVFSYFELLQWLGLDIPEFELAKMSQL